MATPSVEREQTDQETPRTVPETQRDLVRRLLGEVSEMRKENQQLQRGAVRGFRVKRDRPNLFSVIRNLKKI